MRILIAALALSGALMAGCTPMSASDPAVPGQSADASSCASRGGELRRVGRMQTQQCITRYADAGKQCTSGSQCAGDCRVEGNSGIAPGTAAVGQCQAASDRVGCHTTVEDGKAAATLCVD
jgi:nitrous oxide reductase accessory protein NosL